MTGAFRTVPAAALLALTACGAALHIDVHDERLPLEARRWVADAEDAVTIATAELEDTRRALAAERARSLRVPTGATPLLSAWRRLADARVQLAVAEVAFAGGARSAAVARREEVLAATATRYDLGVYELATYQREAGLARSDLQRLTLAVEDQRAVTSALATAFWTAWQDHVAQGGDTGVLWRAPR